MKATFLFIAIAAGCFFGKVECISKGKAQAIVTAYAIANPTDGMNLEEFTEMLKFYSKLDIPSRINTSYFNKIRDNYSGVDATRLETFCNSEKNKEHTVVKALPKD